MFTFKLQETEPDNFTIKMSESPIETRKKYTSNLYTFSIKVKKIYNSQKARGNHLMETGKY